MTHEEAVQIIKESGLPAAARSDLAQVEIIMTAHPELVAAMNALTPKPGEETPQRVAAYRRKLPILQYFMDHGVQPDLFVACAMGLTAIVEVYLKAHPKEVDAKGAHGVPLIFHANHPEMVELLLNNGADPTVALAQLAWSGNPESLKVALKHGAKVDSPDIGRRPLHIAAYQGHLAAVEVLLAAGANTDVKAKGADWEFKNALALAMMKSQTEVVALLRTKLKPKLPPPPPRKFTPRSPRR